MNHPLRFVLIGGLVLGLLGAGAYMYWSASQSSAFPQIETQKDGEVSPTPTPELVFRDDQAGFTLEYPKDLKLNVHEEDTTNYAHLEFTHPSHTGRAIVWVSDLPKGVTDTDSWATYAATSSSAITFDTTLGEKPAKKILDSTGQKRQVVGVVFDGVVWYVEAFLDESGYWQSITQSLMDHFVFKPVPTQAASSGGYDNSYSVDEEEVLE